MSMERHTVAFPGLGIVPFQLDRVAFTIPGIDWPVYWYGILFALAFLLAILYISKRAPVFGLDPDRALDVVLGGALGGIIGARAYFVIFSWDQYKDNLANIFKIWEGGIAIYGSVIGGFLAGYLTCRIRKVKFLPMADLAVGGLILGQAIGRWGNFVNIEAFGSVTGGAWRMCSPAAADFLLRTGQIDQTVADQITAGTLGVHPTFFYESVWCLTGFLLIVWMTGRRRFDGQLTLFYAGWYGLGRSVIEGLRTDSLMWGSVRVSQALAVVLVIASAVAVFVVCRKIKSADGPDRWKLYVDTEEGQAILRGEFYSRPQEGPAAAEEEEPAQTEQPDSGMPAGQDAAPKEEEEQDERKTD